MTLAGEHVIHLTAASFSDTVLASEMPVLVDFWAAWCGPCRMVGPVIDELADEYQGRAKVCKLDVDAEGSVAAQFGVMSIPTIIVFDKGKEHTRVVGVRGKEHLSELLNALL